MWTGDCCFEDEIIGKNVKLDSTKTDNAICPQYLSVGTSYGP